MGTNSDGLFPRPHGSRDEERRSPGLGPGTAQGTDPRAPATEELRYEGPITFDDEPADPEYAMTGSGRTLLTAALLGGAVLVILGIALYLQDDGPSNAGLLADLDTPVEDAPLLGDAFDAPPGGETGALSSDLASADADLGGELGALSSWNDATATEGESGNIASLAGDREEGLREVPSAAPPAAETRPTRPAPRTAATTSSPSKRDAPSTASTSLPTFSGSVASGELRGLVTDGRLREASELAATKARVADPGSYTLQVLFACQPATVQSAFEKGGGDGLMVFSAPHEGNTCYRLTWGVFADRTEAVAQARSVPNHFAGSDRPLPIALRKAAGL